MIPSIINIKIRSGEKFKLRLWLPVFILWPVVLVFFLILLPFLVIADLILRVNRIKIRLFGIIAATLSVLSATRGTIVNVDIPKKDSIVHLKII
jgi:hypothetical protein